MPGSLFVSDWPHFKGKRKKIIKNRPLSKNSTNGYNICRKLPLMMLMIEARFLVEKLIKDGKKNTHVVGKPIYSSYGPQCSWNGHVVPLGLRVAQLGNRRCSYSNYSPRLLKINNTAFYRRAIIFVLIVLISE